MTSQIHLFAAAVLLFGGCVAQQTQTPEAAATEEGFTELFNGSDLSGWMGDTEGYAVENGNLVCLKEGGGKLYVDREFSDFALRFDFRLEEGGNNGVAIRAEPGEDAAYHGMEIQILDDPAYEDLEAYQYHGSVYGVAPAKRGSLAPTGEWNSQEILADGDHVRVTLNGDVIVDVDLQEVAADSTMDGKPHPGLFNQSGHIGFLGHGHRVEFRNIRIKEL